MRTIDDAKALVKKWGEMAGLDEAGIQKLLGNESILSEAKDQLTMHSEMASGIDRAKNEAKAKLDEYSKWYNEQAAPTVAEANKVRAAYQKYRDQYGELDDMTAGPNGNGATKFATPKDVADMGQSGVILAKQIAFITADYNARYGPKFGYLTSAQLDEFEKFAVSRGKPPLQAYEDWVKPKEQEIAEAKAAADKIDLEARIKAAREEGFREGQTRTRWDGESTRKNSDVFGRDPEAVKLAKTSPDDADAAGDKAFLEAWSKWDETHAGEAR